MTTSHRSPAAAIALAAISFAALSLPSSVSAIESVNLTSDAYSKGASYYETGWGNRDNRTTTADINVLFVYPNLNPSERYMSVQNSAVPNYFAFHFKDAYEPGKLIVVNRLYMNVNSANGSWAVNNRRPNAIVLQGANDPDSPFVPGADTDGTLRTSSEGWTDIQSWPSTTWTSATYAGQSVIQFDASFENTTPYRYYRLLVTSIGSGQNDWLQLSRLQLWGYVTSEEPYGMAVATDAGETTADIALSCELFSSANSATAATAIYLDYDTNDTFAEGSYRRVTVAQNVTGTDWSDTVQLTGLFANTAYFGRFIVENAAGGAATNYFEFATGKAWYVDGSGDDDNNDGESANSPFRSITKALSAIADSAVAVPRPIIHVGEGLYSAANGETFPLVLPPGAQLVGYSSIGGNPDREARVIDGGNAISQLISVSGAGASRRIANFHITNNRRNAPVYIDAADCDFDDCLFTQPSNENAGAALSSAGAIQINGESRVTIEDSDFIGITNRYAAVYVTGATVGGTSATAPDSRMVTVRRCRFEENYLAGFAIGGAAFVAAVDLDVSDSIFRKNVFTAYGNLNNTHIAGSCIAACGYRPGGQLWFGSLAVDRCQFIGNRGNMVIGAQFLTQSTGGVDGIFTVANSLFADNVPYSLTASGANYGVINSYRATGHLRGNTFLRNFGGFAREALTYAYNNIFCDETGALTPDGNSYTFVCGPNAIHGCEWGSTAYVSGAANAVEMEPVFRNAAVNALDPAFDATLKAYSPTIDAGAAAQAFGATDLAGNARLADNTGTGAALPDFGCYESTYGVEAVPTFRMPSREYVHAIPGATVSVTATLARASEVVLPLTAAVSAPAGWTCPSTVTFQADAAVFSFTVPETAGEGLETITLAADGVVSGSLDVSIADERVRVTGSRLLVMDSGDQAASFPAALATEGTTASSDIAVALVSVTGDNCATVEWSSTEGRFIAAGESASEASLVITPVAAGTCFVTLAAGANFIESGSDTFTFAVRVDPESFVVDAVNGDDATAVGTAELPFRTITAALAYAESGDTVLLAPGLYAEGETYPFDGAGITFLGSGATPADVMISGTNGAAKIFQRSGSYDSPVVVNVTVGESTAAVADLVDASIVFSNCVFRQTMMNTAEPAIGNLYRASRLELYDCVATNFNRYAAVAFDTTDADVSTSVRTRDRWFEAERCLFDNARCERAFVASRRDNGTPNNVRLTDCTISRMRMYTNQAGRFPGNGSNVYYGGIFHVPTGLAFGGETCQLTADRCLFIACKGNTLVSTSHANGPVFSNCLFADMTNATSVTWGNLMINGDPAKFRNCTFVRSSESGFAGFGMGADIANSIIIGGEMLSQQGSAVALRNSLLDGVADGAYAYVADAETGAVTTNLYKTAVIEADPLFRNAAVDGLDPAFDATLRTGSPAIDAGDNTFASGGLDLSGNPRISHRTVDMGCYESDAAGRGLLILFY